MIRKLFLVVAVVLFATTNLHADQTTIFVSFSGFGEAGVSTNTTEQYQVGDPNLSFGSAFLWIQTDANIDTLSVANIDLSNSNVAVLTGVQVFNPDILLNTDDSDVADRWDSVSAGEVGSSTINDLVGFSSGFGAGTGIRASQDGASGIQRDALFDPSPTANAFLFARVDFEITGVGEVDIVPSGVFLNDGSIGTFSGGNGTIVSIPEPGMAGIIAAALTLGIVRRRK